MRNYELVCAFCIKQDQYQSGMEDVRKILADAKITISSDQDMGEKELAYLINKETHAHYTLFNIEMEQEKISKIDNKLKLCKQLLRYILVLSD